MTMRHAILNYTSDTMMCEVTLQILFAFTDRKEGEPKSKSVIKVLEKHAEAEAKAKAKGAAKSPKEKTIDATDKKETNKIEPTKAKAINADKIAPKEGENARKEAERAKREAEKARKAEEKAKAKAAKEAEKKKKANEKAKAKASKKAKKANKKAEREVSR